MVQRRSGFTLIELLIFSAIFALIVGAFITILVETVSVQSSQSAQNEVSQQGQAIIQQMQYYVEQAKLVDMTLDTASSSLILREAVLANDPTTFTLTNGIISVQQGTSTPVALNSSRVTVSGVSFTRHYNLSSTSSAYGIESVSYSFTVSANGGSQAYSQNFSSSALILNPVPVVALLQHGQTEVNSGTPTSTAAVFPRATEKGTLLLAVTANTSGVTSTVSDTLGNSWNLATSATYSAYTSTLSIFYAVNASSGVDTTTAAFAAGGGKNPSLFLFEYRGNSTSTANLYDSAGWQTQVNTAAPSTPLAYPSQSVPELLFAVDMLGAPTNVSGASGSGYILEASSTGGYSTQVFAEDTNQYIANPVAATFALGGAASSTALLTTFSSANPSYNSGLVGNWKLDEGTGTLQTDWSGNGDTGTSTAMTYVGGKVGPYAGSFNGSSAYVDIPRTAALEPTSSITVVLWEKTSTNNEVLIDKTNVVATNDSYQFYIDGSNHFRWCVYASASTCVTNSAIALNDGNWHQLVGTYDGSILKEYIDGNVQATTAAASGSLTYNTARDVFVGFNSPGSTYYFNGSIDDVRISNRALTGPEVAALYNAQH